MAGVEAAGAGSLHARPLQSPRGTASRPASAANETAVTLMSEVLQLMEATSETADEAVWASLLERANLTAEEEQTRCVRLPTDEEQRH